jgi:hypothetical protein
LGARCLRSQIRGERNQGNQTAKDQDLDDVRIRRRCSDFGHLPIPLLWFEFARRARPSGCATSPAKIARGPKMFFVCQNPGMIGDRNASTQISRSQNFFLTQIRAIAVLKPVRRVRQARDQTIKMTTS